MTREPPPPSADRLEKIRDAVRRDRDLRLRIVSLTENLKAEAKNLHQLEHNELPDLFAGANMRAWTLEAEGNMPAHTATMKPYFHASIAAEWEPERRERAFEWLAATDPDTGGPGPKGGDNPDIIKTAITITLGRGDRATAERVEEFLREQGIPFDQNLTVPWNTLTAFVRELVEKRKFIPPLDLLGAEVGRIVVVKPEEKK